MDMIEKVRQLPDRPSVAQVAEALGVSTQYIRVGLQGQRLSYGDAVRVGGKNRWTYCIFKPRLMAYVEGRDGRSHNRDKQQGAVKL